MMTVSRRRRVGGRHCSMYARKAGPFIAPSSTNGATIPSCRKPATKVIVFQCPCGTAATSRWPRGQRPLSRTMFVLVAVSSINTSRAGSSKPCSRIQRRRGRGTSAPLFFPPGRHFFLSYNFVVQKKPCSRIQRRRARATSARFCSSACRLFFKADIVSIKEPLQRALTAADSLFGHGGKDLLEGQIRLFGNQSQKPFRVLFERRGAPSARFGFHAPCLAPTSTPSDYGTDPHLKYLGDPPPRRSALNRFNRTLTQVRGIRLRHRSSSQANQFLQIRLGKGSWESP